MLFTKSRLDQNKNYSWVFLPWTDKDYFLMYRKTWYNLECSTHLGFNPVTAVKYCTLEYWQEKKENLSKWPFAMVVWEAVQTHNCLNKASRTIRWQMRKTLKIEFDVSCDCCDFLPCLHWLTLEECLEWSFERPFESSHAFRRRFEQPGNTSQYSRSTVRDNKQIIVWWRFPKERLLLPGWVQGSNTVVWYQQAYSCLFYSSCSSPNYVCMSVLTGTREKFGIQESFAARSFFLCASTIIYF